MTDMFDGWTPDEWSANERDLWADVAGYSFEDPVAQALYHEAYFNRDVDPDDRAAIREALEQYMIDEWGIDFAEAFDWETWRELYE